MTSAAVGDPLAPVHRALLDAARVDAARAVAAARAEAETARRAAADQEQLIREAAVASGETDGRVEVAQQRRQARRRARATVLAAQQEVYLDLRSRVHARLAALRDDASYPGLREVLAAHAHVLLGPEALVTEAEEGGIAAEAPGRAALLTFPALADQALAELGADVEALWRP
jgi:vacuolar-type H+-ATPase subunit E/Vma4